MRENDDISNLVLPDENKPRKNTLKEIFITGIVALLPLVVTIYILKLLYGLIVSNLMPLFHKIIRVSMPEPLMGVMTVVMFVLIIFLIGLLTRMYVGRFILNLVERAITAIPLANTIYGAIKQMIDSFKSSSNNFQKVVLVNFLGENSYCLGFVVKNSQPVIRKNMEAPSYNVFVPTAPNPISGFITVLPVSACKELDVTVEEGIKFVISVGLINFANDDKEIAGIVK